MCGARAARESNRARPGRARASRRPIKRHARRSRAHSVPGTAAREKGGAPRENCEGEIDRRRAPPRDIHPMNRLVMRLALSIDGRPQMRREH